MKAKPCGKMPQGTFCKQIIGNFHMPIAFGAVI